MSAMSGAGSLSRRLAALGPGLIDMHTHAIDPDLPDVSQAYQGIFPSVRRLSADRAQILVDGQVYREVDRRCWSAEARIRDMDAEGVAAQLVSATPVTLCHGEPAAGARVLAAAGTDEHMAGLLRWTLRDPDIPAAEKDPANWPASMRAEWADDGGTAAAAQHRKLLRENLARCRQALDEFRPDLVVVWGDDQYENFREEVVPPFCVSAYGDLEVPAFEVMNERGSPNAWGKPDDMTVTFHGDATASRELADTLIADGFDMAYSYRKREGGQILSVNGGAA